MSKKIEPWQARQLQAGLFPGANYLIRLRLRMEKVGFVSGDQLFHLVCAAQDAMQHLRTEVHYLSCESGVGRPSDRPG